MSFLLDSNILVRLSNKDDPQFAEAAQAVEAVRKSGHELNCTPQTIREFWVVGTRPRENNGLGLAVHEARALVARFGSLFPLRPETPAVYDGWLRLVTNFAVCGKKAHDTGYIAAMQAHEIGDLLTFNRADFERYSALVRIWTPLEFITAVNRGEQ